MVSRAYREILTKVEHMKGKTTYILDTAQHVVGVFRDIALKLEHAFKCY